MYNILTLNKIASVGTDNFDRTKYTVSTEAENPDGIMVRSANMLDYEFGSNLVAIARAGAGVNNIPVDRCSEMGICVFNTPGANANAVKEMVVAGLLLTSRKIAAAIDWAKTLKGQGDEVSKLVEKGKSQFAGPEIMGKTLGIIGLGAIGVKVANTALALGMKVIGYDPFLSVTAALGLNPGVKVVKSQAEVFAESDYLTLHLPYNKDTKDTVCADTIAKMKRGVRILNFARGELVNTPDIIAALSAGDVAAYITDFPNDELIGVEGVTAIPHLGASTPESEDNCAVMAAKELVDYIEYGKITNSVNLPNCELNKTADQLVCIIHKNVPAIITQVTGVISNAGGNIESIVNKSKKDWAYTMVDVTGDVDSAKADILAIEGVTGVRIL
ncbi:MAG TPA: 3-phosphoglycerate dehydrogenase [Candidatus Faeciplasma pullistercoris]|uniref:D-3-phosphoglycerate dehydrogenase n=1 Tax=Candidatus Faeciplasma pullistercoris TaxID=2840800 RepID=A0A9D1GS03_9FIRM|nr:3-phosphoglycerate dehydrogenase [Candidatus Faeciplasma pullistercoris]